MLENLLTELYQRRYRDCTQVGKHRVRHLEVPHSEMFEVFLSGIQREDYERQIGARKPGQACRLCWPCHSLVFRKRIAIAPDDNPCFPSHMLLRPVHPARIDETFRTVGHDMAVGLVTPQHLDCREQVTANDIAIMVELAEAAPSYQITQSVDGSGASIPEHVHAHLFQQSQACFPLMMRRCFSPVPGADAKVLVNRQYTYAVLVRGESRLIAAVLSALRDEFGYPSNHYFRVDPDWGLIGLYVPRTDVTPSVPEIKRAAWRFGAFEVLGLFDAKNSALYENLTAEQACHAIREVTLHEPSAQRAIESCAVNMIRRSAGLRP